MYINFSKNLNAAPIAHKSLRKPKCENCSSTTKADLLETLFKNILPLKRVLNNKKFLDKISSLVSDEDGINELIQNLKELYEKLYTSKLEVIPKIVSKILCYTFRLAGVLKDGKFKKLDFKFQCRYQRTILMELNEMGYI